MRKYLAVIVLSICFIFTACSNSGNESQTGGDSTASPAPAATNGGKEQVKAAVGGELIVAVDQDPVGLDPHTVPALSSQRVYALVYDSLIRMAPDFKLEPSLAGKWTVSPDGKTVTFELRQGVKFHNGRELTSDDVKYSYERILNPDTGAIAKAYFASVESVETPDQHTVVFHLKHSDSSFLANTASPFASIVPKEVADLNTEAVGSGPYKLEKLEPGQAIQLKKNADFYEPNFPVADSIKMIVMKDEAERLAAIRTGKVQVTAVSADSAKLLESASNVTIKQYQSIEISQLGINTAKEPLHDLKVRQAIAYAIDRNAIIQTVWKGQASLTGPLPPSQTELAVAPKSYPYYTRDVQKAKQLLAEAGYPDGFKTTILTSSTYTDMIETAQMLQQQLKEIGITAEINQVEWGNYVKLWGAKEFDLFVGRSTTGSNPDKSLRNTFSSEGTGNKWGYSNAHYDDIVQKALEAVDQAERKKLYTEAQQMILDEAPVLFFASPINFYAVSNTVDGFVPSASGGEPYALLHSSAVK